MPLLPGAQPAAYMIVAPIGVGGMGELYRARDARLDRDVAIKVLPQAVAADPHARAFEREAKAIAALSHPHILAIHDFGVDGASASPAMFAQLTDFPGIERSPILSSDGKAVVYASDASAVTPSAWSRDGSRIALFDLLPGAADPRMFVYDLATQRHSELPVPGGSPPD